MQFDERIDEGARDSTTHLLVRLHAIGEGVIEDDPRSPLHHVEGSPYDGLILAEEIRFGGEREDGVEPGQDARLAAMSWAFGGTGPSGGRRRTPSQSPTFKR